MSKSELLVVTLSAVLRYILVREVNPEHPAVENHWTSVSIFSCEGHGKRAVFRTLSGS